MFLLRQRMLFQLLYVCYLCYFLQKWINENHFNQSTAQIPSERNHENIYAYQCSAIQAWVGIKFVSFSGVCACGSIKKRITSKQTQHAVKPIRQVRVLFKYRGECSLVLVLRVLLVLFVLNLLVLLVFLGFQFNILDQFCLHVQLCIFFFELQDMFKKWVIVLKIKVS